MEGAAPAETSLSVLHKQFNDYLFLKDEEIREQRTARQYYHGDQLSPQVLTELKKRKQPPTTTPIFARKMNGFAGLLNGMRTDPKAYPRTPQHEEGAELVTAAIRYVCDDQDVNAIAGDVALTLGYDGVAVVEVTLEKSDSPDPKDHDIRVEVVPSDTFFYDPLSIRADFSDAKYMGVSKWFDIEDAKRMFPDKAGMLGGVSSDGSAFGIQTDRDEKWYRTDKKQVRIVEHWYREGDKWAWCFYTGEMKLSEGGAYLKDEKNRDICRFLPVSAFTDHDGDRYSFFRNMKSSIDEINHRNSKALHLLNMRRIMAPKGAFDNINETRAEAVKPDGVILYNPTGGEAPMFEDGKNLADMRGQVEMQERARTEMENFGPNPALVGQGVEAKSGRAIALLQQAGLAELGPFIQAYKSWKLRLYKAIWHAVRVTWTAERWIRVTDHQGLIQQVQINGMQPGPMGPMLVNALGNIGVDIIIDEGPDHINMQADALEVLQAAQAQGQAIPPEVTLELLPIAETLKRKLVGMMKEAREQPDPAMIAEKAKMESAQAMKAMELEAKAKSDMQSSAIEQTREMQRAEIEREKAAAQIELHRMKLEADIATKEREAQIALKLEVAKLNMQRATAQEKTNGEIRVKEMDFKPMTDAMDAFRDTLTAIVERIGERDAAMIAALTAPRSVTLPSGQTLTARTA
jgi:hypothetical protein